MKDANDIDRGVAAMETGGVRGTLDAPGASATGSGAEPKSENFFEFRDVCKSFDENEVLKNVSFTREARRDLRDHGTQRRGQVGFAETHHGIHESGFGANFCGRTKT